MNEETIASPRVTIVFVCVGSNGVFVCWSVGNK